MKLNRTIKFRLSEIEEKRLEQLARATGEDKSAILRKLIRTAEVSQRPTVQAGVL
jgi:predicted DNA-binding protein